MSITEDKRRKIESNFLKDFHEKFIFVYPDKSFYTNFVGKKDGKYISINDFVDILNKSLKTGDGDD
jgi:hypothetical protein